MPDDLPQQLETAFKHASDRFDFWFPTISNSAVVTQHKEMAKGLLGVENVGELAFKVAKFSFTFWVLIRAQLAY